VLALVALAVAQAVLAAPPENVRFTISDPTPNDQVLDRSFSGSATDADEDIAAYEWDFDFNGTFTVDATGQNPTHTFPSPRSYSIALRVRDGTVNDNEATTTGPVVHSVNVTVPNRNPAASIESITRQPDPAHPNNGDLPYVGQPIKFNGTGTDPDGDPVTYAWDFGDGQSSTQEDPVHAYNSHGTKRVRLTVRDNRGGETTTPVSTVRVNAVPNGAFSFLPSFPLPGELVTFTSTSSPSEPGKQITNVEWDFDYARNTGAFTPDAVGARASHSFPSAGAKTVAIRATDGPAGGSDIETATVVVNAPPQAGFHVAPETAFVGDNVTLSSTSFDSDGPLPTQEWDLDNDGQFDDANAAVVSARFGRRGTYPLKLRVTDSIGASSTATGRVIVKTRPVPPLQILSGVEINARFLVFPRRTKVQFLRVRAPTGSRISVRCLGKGCPKGVTKRSKGSKVLQFKKLQRMYRPRTTLIVSVTKSGSIGKQTRWTIRARKPPIKRSRCLNPGGKKAIACPSG
jgi:PKD repeat protein